MCVNENTMCRHESACSLNKPWGCAQYVALGIRTSVTPAWSHRNSERWCIRVPRWQLVRGVSKSSCSVAELGLKLRTVCL